MYRSDALQTCCGVVTNYPTAKSQIQDGIDGKIVPMDNKGCARGLAEFIMNTELQKQIKEYLRSHDYGNMGEVEKLYDLINDNENDNENEFRALKARLCSKESKNDNEYKDENENENNG